MMPTLAQVQSYDTDHLADAATYWQHIGTVWDDHYSAAEAQATGLDWRGAAGEALLTRVASDRVQVGAASAEAWANAGYARAAASDLSALHRTALYAIEDAQSAGFQVGQDFSVTAPTPALEPTAKAMQVTIVGAVSNLIAHDTAVGAGLGVQPLDGPVCDDPNWQSHVDRSFWGKVGSGFLGGGAIGITVDGVGVIPGAIGGAAIGGIDWFITEIESDGPKCK